MIEALWLYLGILAVGVVIIILICYFAWLFS